MKIDQQVKKILILAANPIDLPPLRLEQEVRDLEEGLERSKKRDQFVIVKKSAVRSRDFRRALMDIKPQIVHFCGHGLKQEGIALETEVGKVQLVSSKALSQLFELFSKYVKCVVLNACFSQEQAEAISQHIDYVVGMSQAIGDQAAIEFSVAFYDALMAENNALEISESIELAYRLGCTAINMVSFPDSLKPVLFKRPKSKISKIFISYNNHEPDVSLAQEFCETLKEAKHEVFMSAESISLGEDWPRRIDFELKACDYFLLLLSAKSANSEMVIEKVRRAKKIRDSHSEHRPVILVIRVDLPIEASLNFDLDGYLSRTQQRVWHSKADTPKIIKEIVSLIAEGRQNVNLAPKSAPISSSCWDKLDLPPSPVAEPQLPQGQVDLASAFYVERPPIESRCFKSIVKPGALIRIKAPRQMGKTSLMARILYYARQQNYKVVPLSFQLADEIVFSDLDKFLQWFCAAITFELELPDHLNDFWQNRLGSKMSCTNYFERYLLQKLDNSSLVLGLDEVDLVFQHKAIASNFFGLLRAWHEKGKIRDLWKKLRLIVVHSTEIYIPLNVHQSPFNVGLPIELHEFNADQVLDLADRHGLSWDKNEVEQLMAMVGGHPYLVREALYHITHKDLKLEEFLQTAWTEEGLFRDHLRRHWWNLSQHSELLESLNRVVNSSNSVRLEPIQAFQLYSMGLVYLKGNNVMPRCDLYRRYFQDHL